MPETQPQPDTETDHDNLVKRLISRSIEIGNNKRDDLDPRLQEQLVQEFGPPVEVDARFSLRKDRQMHGTCPANEKSIAALIRGRKHWGRYNLIVIDESIIHYKLGGDERIITSRIVVGKDGGVLLPGYIYTEKHNQYDEETEEMVEQETLGNYAKKVLDTKQSGVRLQRQL